MKINGYTRTEGPRKGDLLVAIYTHEDGSEHEVQTDAAMLARFGDYADEMRLKWERAVVESWPQT